MTLIASPSIRVNHDPERSAEGPQASFHPRIAFGPYTVDVVGDAGMYPRIQASPIQGDSRVPE
jgi:hypothetical protein